ncbi:MULTISPECIES: amino acid ABC transporter substrate-binding protein [unclassified Pseudomonas]|uniref:amino acid ABC transporter substrate-binding protein n=1 Tax=unclassified Pseudomonas TaxID=196821 RepID=UPI000C2F896B|nr:MULTISPECIES: amino acid ABC transporter substrate-binding protein [unclassified Pseudomonas]MCU1738002.1 amino acid ABC transporter substrate-binding protein [Pseudomonas sp. 20S_6.2_Bac1]
MKRERSFSNITSVLAALAVTAAFAGNACAGATQDNVKKKGYVQCGISDGLPGFSYPDAKGEFHGFDVDVCRAVAAAVLGDAKKVRYVQLTAKERFTALQSGEVDMLSRSTTWTSSRDGAMGILFANVAYYDGQGFLVNKKLGVKSAKELNGATFCIQAGTVTELNLADYFRANGMTYTPISFDTSDESFKALESGRCDVLTTDQSQLYGQRLKLANPDDYEVLPDVISKEPLTPAVRRGDEDWFTVVRWTQSAMLNAEEMGVTSKNVAELVKTTKNPDIARLLGNEGSLGKDLNLPNNWAVQIISQVGNYGESFDRNLGEGSDMKIKRGLNALWTHGGLQYGPPVR